MKIKKIILTIIVIFLFTNCNNSRTKSIDKNNRLELVLKPNKELRKEYEKQQELDKSKCDFINPDTSVVGINIRNVESTLNILGKHTKLGGDSTYVFYSRDKKQKLGLTVHPGDYYNQVSIFNISYSNNSKESLRHLKSKEFETEKGIKLGINKKEIIEKLGTCYIVTDSTKNNIVLNYRIESSNDSMTKLLKNNNMPIYYATYKLINDKLVKIEFGFEYP